MIAAQVRGPRQRADKHGQMPRELADLVLFPDGIFTLRIISHDLSLPVQARQVPLVTGRACTVGTSWGTHARHTADCVHDARVAAVRLGVSPM